MTEIRAPPRAMKNPIDLRRPATTITPAYAMKEVGSGFQAGVAFRSVALPRRSVVRVWKLGCFPRGGFAGDARHPNGLRDAGKAEKLDQEPGWVELKPRQPMPCRCGMGVVVIVPPFAESKKRDPPAIAGIIAS